MNKPIIAIFCAGNLPTASEQKLINSLAHLPCVILNAETYVPQESLVVDAVVGVVPDHLKYLPDPDTVIKRYEDYLAGTGKAVGGSPPEPPDSNGTNNTNNTDGFNGANGNNGNNGSFGEERKDPPQNGFGNPPVPPKDK